MIDRSYFILGIFAISGIMLASLINVNNFGARLFVHLFGLISLLLLYSVREHLEKKLTYPLVRMILFIYLIFAFLQMYDPTFGSIFIMRDAAQTLGYSASGRGYRSLAAEPNQFGQIIIMLYIFIIYLIHKRYENGEITKKSVNTLYSRYSILLIFSLVILCRSATALLYFLLIALLLGVHLRLWAQLIKFFIGGALVLSFGLTLLEESRLTVVLISLVTDPDFILRQGAFARFYNLPITIAAAVQNLPFGTGVENSIGREVTVWTPLGNYTTYVASRTLGGISELLLNHGFLSILSLFTIFWLFVVSKYKIFSASFFLLILVSGAVFMPTVLLGLVVLTVARDSPNSSGSSSAFV